MCETISPAELPPAPDVAAPTNGQLAAQAVQAVHDSGPLSSVVLTVRRGTQVDVHRVPALTLPVEMARILGDPDRDLLSIGAEQTVSLATPALPVAATPTRMQSSDPMRSQQWAFDRHTYELAWACGRGAGATVAVIDTGVQGDHPDLAGRVFGGVAFRSGNGTISGVGNVDGHGHGTHVAGTIAAGTDDGIGIAGVAPEARILPVRVLGETGSGSSTDVAAAILWASDQGRAQVLNLSLGGSNDPSIRTAVAVAVARGVVVVSAAGNSGTTVTNPSMPGGAPESLTVAATDRSSAVAWFSTRGPHVDIAAPGVGIRSTVSGSSWATMSGTSMATPHVAGVAALLAGAHPGAPAGWIVNRITSSAADLLPMGWDSASGWGEMNPAAAVGARPG